MLLIAGSILDENSGSTLDAYQQAADWDDAFQVIRDQFAA